MHRLLYILLMLIGCTSRRSAPTTADNSSGNNFKPVSAPLRKAYTLPDLAREILHYQGIKFDSLCLVEKQMSSKDAQEKTWCATCTGTVGLRFKENEEGETNALQIGERSIPLRNMLFQPTNGISDTVSFYTYSIGCAPNLVRQFSLGPNTFLNFSAGIHFCNGSSCGENFEFLYCYTTNKLYAFDLFRGLGYFGDANADSVIDYMEILPDDAWSKMDTVSVRFYSLNEQTQLFEPLKNEQGQEALVHLATSGQDYRQARQLKVIHP